MAQRTQQSGSMIAVAVICLSLGLVVALGWIFYQNFILKEEVKKETELVVVDKRDADSDDPSKKVDDAKDETLVYKADDFTFEYPKSGWERKNGPGETHQRIATSDYEEDIHTGWTTKGARIEVYVNDIDKAGEFRKPTVKDAHGISDIQVLEVDGRTAYYNKVEYEGTRYQIHFQSDTKDYQVELMADGDATRAEKDVFNQVWKSFKLK